MKPLSLLLSSIAIFTLSHSAFAADEKANHAAPHWGYEGEAGAEKWSSLDQSFALCEHGKSQSPINIIESIEADLPTITFSYMPFLPKIINNGHTIQVNAPAGSSITVGKAVYSLLQFHFHSPSEYQIDGKTYPLEVHFVHKQENGALAVVGVMFEEAGANAELEKILQNMPNTTGENEVKNAVLDTTKLLPTDQKYYRFMGSLTTPPCSEGVNWHMMQHPITASKEQINAFKKLFPMNARPLQPSNNRLIVKDNK